MTGMRAALKIARSGRHPIYKMGAAVVRGGSILATGYNHRGIHAEESAIGKVSKWKDPKHLGARGANVFVTREGGNGKSKPCARCQRLLKEAGIRKVVYFNYNGQAVSERIL